MPVSFIIRGIVQRGCFIGIAGMDVFAFHYPDAHAFHPAGIHIPCILYSHRCIGCVQTAHMFVIEPLFAADEYFP